MTNDQTFELKNRKLIDFAESLFTTLRERSSECEEIRQVPEKTITDLVNGGIMRSTVPRRLGGGEIDYRTAMLICAAISRGCGSTGLVVANMLGCALTTALWPEQAQRDVWGNSIDTIVTGTLIFPKGRAKIVNGGYVLSGNGTSNGGFTPPMDCRDNPRRRALHQTKWHISTPARDVLLLRR